MFPGQLGQRYLFGSLPLTNVFILVAQLAGVAYVSLEFDSHFGAKPVLTTMVMNSVRRSSVPGRFVALTDKMLNGVADTVAQTVTAARQRASRRTVAKKDSVSIVIHELDEKSLPSHRSELFPQTGFDIDRLVRFMSWGFLMAPLQLWWFGLLSDLFPVSEGAKTAAVLWKVLLDQAVFSPFGLALFFVFMTITEGGGKKAVVKKLDHIFLSTLKSNYVLWPAVQVLNFQFMPLQFQLPFASAVGICWTTYLSLKNEDA